MARELSIDIVVETGAAKRDMAAVDAGMATLTSTAIGLHTQLLLQESAAKSSATAMRGMADAIVASGTATQAQMNALATASAGHLKLQGAVGATKAEMAALAPQTTTVTGHFDSLKSVVTDLALGFAALFTARAAINFVSNVLEEASALKDLSQQTHINVEDLQLLAGAMSEFGVDADTLGRGLFTLSRKIAGGDESVARALHMMGLSLKDVEGMQGQELFLKMEHGLSTLQGSLRDTAASDLFGSRMGAAMAGAAEGIDAALDHARRFNTVVTSESIDAMDKYGEAIKRAWTNMKAMAGNMIGPVAEGFNTLNDATVKGASKWDIFVAVLKDWATSSSVTGANASHLATVLDHVNQQTEQAVQTTKAFIGPLQEVAVALDAEGQAAKFMAALQVDALDTITPVQRGYLEQLKQMGALTAQNAAGIGVSSQAYKKYTADVEETGKMLALVHQIEKTYLTDSKKEFDAWSARLTIVTDRVTQAILAESAAHTQLNAAMGLDALGHQKVTSAAETLRIGLEKLHATKAEGISQSAQEQVLIDAYTKALYDDAVAQDKLNQSVAATVPTFEQAAAAAKRLHDELNNIQQLLVDTDLGAALPTLGGPGQGATHPHITGQSRAKGGPVSSGRTYLVGERGPELFTPGQSGGITPNGAGGTVLYVTITGNNIDSDYRARRLADQTADRVMQRFKQQSRITYSKA